MCDILKTASSVLLLFVCELCYCQMQGRQDTHRSWTQSTGTVLETATRDVCLTFCKQWKEGTNLSPGNFCLRHLRIMRYTIRKKECFIIDFIDTAFHVRRLPEEHTAVCKCV